MAHANTDLWRGLPHDIEYVMITHSGRDWQAVISNSNFARKVLKPSHSLNGTVAHDTPRSPIGDYPMQPWIHVPTDWRRPTTPSYQLYWCNRTQYGMLHPRPTSDQIASAYDVDNYYTHDSTFSEDAPAKNINKPGFVDWLMRRISWQLDDSIEIRNGWFDTHFPQKQRRGRVLDLGCGSGKILLRFREKGFTETIGVEPDPNARKAAISHGLTVLDGTAESLPSELHGEQFDVILMTHVLEHTLDPVQAMKNATQLLAPNGRLIVETPNNLAIGLEEAGATWRWLDVPRHLNFFTPQSLRAMCDLVGLDHSATEFRGYYRQFTSEWIANEQYIWDCYNNVEASESKLPPRNHTMKTWQLLGRTLFAPDEKRYDSVRVIASKPA